MTQSHSQTQTAPFSPASSDVDPGRRLRLVGTPVDRSFVLPPADLWVFQTGPNRLAQVECVREVSKTLVTRMVLYRTAIRQMHPQAELDQYVIVVGDGTVRPLDDPVGTGVYFGLNVLYLRDVEPLWYEASPGFVVLRHRPATPRYCEILDQVDMTLGRFLVSVHDPVHETAVLHDGSQRAREGVPELLLSLYFQGRFGEHPDIPVARRHDGWPIDVTVALAVHAIIDFDRCRARAVRRSSRG